MRKSTLSAIALGTCLLGSVGASCADSGAKTTALPQPDVSGGVPVMKAFAERQSVREFDLSKPVDNTCLSNLLWAAWGINRTNGKRTVPTALNKQEMRLYVASAEGVWRYEAKENALVKVSDRDMRVGQMQKAPLNFVYAGSTNRFNEMHAGAMFQSAGLCAASLGLGNVVIYSPVEELQKTGFPLDDGYHIIVAQSFGWSK